MANLFDNSSPKKWGEQFNYASTVIFMTQYTIQNGDFTAKPQKTLYLLK
jgi:hypothetical protein